jgi:hypothetical protein
MIILGAILLVLGLLLGSGLLEVLGGILLLIDLLLFLTGTAGPVGGRWW